MSLFETLANSVRQEDFAFLQDHVYRRSGIVLDSDKEYLMHARLGPVMRKFGLGSIHDLCNLLRGVNAGSVPALNHAQLNRDVVEAMTTNETFFFREPAQYEVLRQAVLPQLRMARGRNTIRIWSAAASTGQEAYSLAMVMLDMGWPESSYEIVATDINEAVLERARQGRYLQIEVDRGLPAHYLGNYFERDGANWRLKDCVRRVVRFQPFDLRESMVPLGNFDIVFCRNVLIYFDAPTKQRILSQIRGILAADGFLVLGGAEATSNTRDLFDRLEMGPATVYKRSG